MDIEFKKANADELGEIFEIYTAAIRLMDSQGIYQWDEIYPDKNILSEDIKKGELFVGRSEGMIVSAYAISDEFDDGYKNGKWEFDCFQVIHRLCVSPEFQGIGVGEATVRHIEKSLAEKGVKSIRLDAFTQNTKAVKMYNRLGYKTVGFADFRKGKFILMEKPI